MLLIAIGGLVVLVAALFSPLDIWLPALALYLAIAGHASEAQKQHKALLVALGAEEEQDEPKPKPAGPRGVA